MVRRRAACRLLTIALGACLAAVSASAQTGGRQGGPPAPAAAPEKDSLGRDTPRGTVFGLMRAARDGRDDVAPLYLNTRHRGKAAADLAHQLYVVLDRRLPARLGEISDRPEGSGTDPLDRDRDVIGRITGAARTVDIVVERVNRGSLGSVWLFSSETLDAIPDLFAEVNRIAIDGYLPDFLLRAQIGGVRLFGWLVVGLLIPLSYLLAGLLGRLLRPALAAWHRRFGDGTVPPDRLPGFVRLVIVAAGIGWLSRSIDLTLRERLFWAAAAGVLVIAAVVWALLLGNAVAERYARRHARQSATLGEMASLLRLGRRLLDVLIVSAGLLVVLRYFGVDPTAALAGLGIGGIAIALAAQKTLENVVGGVSIIVDKAVRVGDTVRLGETRGTVEYIGLRSTRIRTFDRTILSVPNGQIANVNVETLSARDKYSFSHVLRLRYETTSAQLRTIVDGIKRLLARHAAVDGTDTLRVRFVRVGASSLEIEVATYILAADWEAFLEVQQELLIGMMEIVEETGTAMALPAQTLQLSDPRGAQVASRVGVDRPGRRDPARPATGSA